MCVMRWCYCGQVSVYGGCCRLHLVCSYLNSPTANTGFAPLLKFRHAYETYVGHRHAHSRSRPWDYLLQWHLDWLLRVLAQDLHCRARSLPLLVVQQDLWRTPPV